MAKKQEQKKQGRAVQARLRAVYPVGLPDGTRAEPGEEFSIDMALADRLVKKGAAELVEEKAGDDGQAKDGGQQQPQDGGQDGEGKDGEGGEG